LTDDLIAQETTIKDVLSQMDVLVMEFKQNPNHVGALITLALRVFVDYQKAEAELDDNPYLNTGTAGRSQSCYRVLPSTSQGRDMIRNLLMRVLGDIEGKCALSNIENFISEISPNQDLPPFHKADFYDLSFHLD